MPWTQYVITVISEEIVGTCFKKELQKTNQKVFRVEKVIKKKGVLLTVALMKKT